MSYAMYTLEGVDDAEVGTYYYTTEDGLGLSLLRFQKPGRSPDSPAVLLVHCHSLSTDQFIMPEHENLVRYLHANGYEDVFSVDLRNSNRHPYNLWAHDFSMDDIALYDYPPAIEIIRREIGPRPLHVICQGLNALTFSMSLAARRIHGFASVILNSASLIPRPSTWTVFKMRTMLVPFQFFFLYADPSFSKKAAYPAGKALSWLISLFHDECDVPACHMGSFMYGNGKPALFNHERISPVTHQRLGQLFGPTRLVYGKHLAKMARAGGAVKYRMGDPRYGALPDRYTDNIEQITEPILFVNGVDNRVFFDTNIRCYRTFAQRLGDANIHGLFEVPGYGHIDIFMGETAAKDVFPTFLGWLDEHGGPPG